jgi:hypothetical protein
VELAVIAGERLEKKRFWAGKWQNYNLHMKITVEIIPSNQPKKLLFFFSLKSNLQKIMMSIL